jgi:hypothetical protein
LQSCSGKENQSSYFLAGAGLQPAPTS